MVEKRDGCPEGQMRLGDYCIPAWCDTIIRHYGHTNETPLRGFLLPDGSAIDFSKLHHTEIAKPFQLETDTRFHRSAFGIMSKFIKGCRSMRYALVRLETDKKKRILLVDTASKPTPEQIEKINYYIPVTDGLYAERSDDNIWPCSYEKENPKPMDMQKFISKCW